MADWHELLFLENELNLKLSLSSGLVFSWQCLNGSEWTGVLANRLYVLKQINTSKILYQVWPDCSHGESSSSFLTDFFRLNDHSNLNDLLIEWSGVDPVFRKKLTDATLSGVRLLRVDPFESLVSFICSSNNNIGRITHMVHSLCHNFGECVAKRNDRQFYSFPTLPSMCQEDLESRLRLLGFGYRAKYINKCVSQVMERGGEEWLQSLKLCSYTDAWKSLQELAGVGPKVADCVCLMGLGHLEAVPVDTHILKITARDYKFEVPSSLTRKAYHQIGQHYRTLFGNKAGWAQAVLFAAEIKSTKAKRDCLK